MQHGLDFGGIDVEAARDHHVALAVADEDIAVLVDVTDVARGDEPVALDLGALFRLVMIGEIRIVRDPRIDLADLALPQAIAILAEKAQFDAIADPPHGSRFPQPLPGIAESHPTASRPG